MSVEGLFAYIPAVLENNGDEHRDRRLCRDCTERLKAAQLRIAGERIELLSHSLCNLMDRDHLLMEM